MDSHGTFAHQHATGAGRCASYPMDARGGSIEGKGLAVPPDKAPPAMSRTARPGNLRNLQQNIGVIFQAHHKNTNKCDLY